MAEPGGRSNPDFSEQEYCPIHSTMTVYQDTNEVSTDPAIVPAVAHPDGTQRSKPRIYLVSFDDLPTEVKAALQLLSPDIKTMAAGCDAVFPPCLEGCAALDLGSGVGVDCFVLSKLVGPSGHVIGVDITPEMVELSKEYTNYHMKQFGYTEPNVDFKLGNIEKLGEIALKDCSFDIVISNCAICCTSNKRAVFKEAYRVLKPGAELYFSDLYVNQPVPQGTGKDHFLWGDLLHLALQWKDLMGITTEVGFAPPVLVKSTTFTYTDTENETPGDTVTFCSATYRLFKPSSPAQPTTPDTLMEVQYKGSIKEYEGSFPFSYHGPIPASCPVPLPTSVARLLQESRFAPHFTFQPLPEGKEVTPVCPGLKEFLEVDPFEVSNRTIAIDPPPIQADHHHYHGENQDCIYHHHGDEHHGDCHHGQ